MAFVDHQEAGSERFFIVTTPHTPPTLATHHPELSSLFHHNIEHSKTRAFSRADTAHLKQRESDLYFEVQEVARSNFLESLLFLQILTLLNYAITRHKSK